MTSDDFASLKGHFLMAMPSLADPNFHRSVTCVSEHTPDGAVGIVISQVYPQINGGMIFSELGIECDEQARMIPVHRGGPVHVDELFVLHGPPFDWDEHLMITDELALGNSRSILEAVAMNRGPEYFLMALGCAGWGPGQLEWEMMQNAWLTLPCSQDIIFKLPVEERWKNAMTRLGIDPDMIVETAGNA